ncbi:MAG: hypothetical protein HY925_10950 [Elusimicrobia bacterium]|nr:hypothetical protein [Elusimicrobiota bacterium]
MRRWLARFGLVLSLAANAHLAFHVDHADSDHANPQHHCCPCHVYVASPNAEAAVAAPAVSLSGVVAARTLPRVARLGGAPDSARAPPVA